ncbi:hypothetical protein CHS0354_014125 [Potamilus streckersoni]|uniref:Peroxidase n=1 Tax=Potamilus streckersoni TaxID=2493646 RepID=A0AAE0WF30_9BIVA|nr:hypothetical protein CHS0354_014125 [Potamilus streckersoni]
MALRQYILCAILVIVPLSPVLQGLTTPREIGDTINSALNEANRRQENRTKNGGKSLDQLFLFHNRLGSNDQMTKDKELLDSVMKVLQERGKSFITMDTVKQQLQGQGICVPKAINCSLYIDSPYRTIDGSCNNLDHPQWGMSFKPQRRLLPPAYEKGPEKVVRSLPRCRGKNGKPLPNPRTVSNNIHKSLSGSTTQTNEASLMLFQWGQFIAHDIGLTPVSTRTDGSAPECCGVDKYNLDLCLPIEIPPGDDYFKNGTCLNFIRSAAVVSEDCTVLEPREQINKLTSYMDGSLVYGSTKAEHTRLRNGVFMKVSPGPNLPENKNASCTIDHKGEFCMDAGDSRVNVVPSLASMHTLFVWEHNRIAAKLIELWGTNDNETVFQETRKIVTAQIQRINYDEFLPTFLPNETVRKYKLRSLETGYMEDSEYNKSSDPAISSDGFYSFRNGHSWIPNQQSLTGEDGVLQTFNVEQTYNNPHLIFLKNLTGAHAMLRWMASTGCPRSDRIIEAGARDKLFMTKDGASLDLAAVNINRGRDHGLLPYGEYRKLCGLSPLTESWDSLVDHTPEVRELLKNTYDQPADIDFYTGELSETPGINGRTFGPTLNCIVAKEFHNLKFSDRYWHERKPPEGFAPDQLRSIRKVSLASVLCENVKYLQSVPKDPFLSQSCSNPLVSCSDVPKLDLTPWKQPYANRPG